MPGESPRWRRWLKPLGAVAIVAIIVRAAAHYAQQIQPQLTAVRLVPLLGALGLCIIYRVLNSAGWVLVLRALNQPMPLLGGMRLWLLAESARWLPGSVWGFCSRVVQARKIGVPPAIASASLPLELLLTIAAWSSVAISGLALSERSVDWSHLVSLRTLLLGGMFAALFAAGVFAFVASFPHSRVAGKIRHLRDEILALRQLPLRTTLLSSVAAFYAALCILNGLAFALAIRALSDAPLSLPALVGVNACGWLIGFFAIGAPGGIGVREATSAFLLSSLVPLPTAIAASVLWRLMLIVDEVICLGTCLAPRAAQVLHLRRAHPVPNPVAP